MFILNSTDSFFLLLHSLRIEILLERAPSTQNIPK